ncbi:hypothetical protein EDD15DRAFT_991267 [Pisolithus albus]|nr:hypothetical protein EDD15DRAFT_991267 [Pisolithus albus]
MYLAVTFWKRHSHSISFRRSVKQLTVAGQVGPLRTRASHFVHFTSCRSPPPEIFEYSRGEGGDAIVTASLESSVQGVLGRWMVHMLYPPSNDFRTVGCLRLTNQQLVLNNIVFEFCFFMCAVFLSVTYVELGGSRGRRVSQGKPDIFQTCSLVRLLLGGFVAAGFPEL